MVVSKIESGLYDEDIENYIYCLDANNLCNAIVEITNMVSTVLRFIESDIKRSIETLQMIENNYLDVCKRWENYDCFGTIAYRVIRSNLIDIIAQVIAARILYAVAMQRLVDDLIETGMTLL